MSKSKTGRADDGNESSDDEDVIDFSFCNLGTTEDCLYEIPRPSFKQKQSKQRKTFQDDPDQKKYKSHCLRLNNNCISEASLLPVTVGKMFRDMHAISWIDLSYNAITSIEDCFLDFENLLVLYLHGNRIENIEDVQKLSALTRLKKLTLHGNDIETNAAKNNKGKNSSSSTGYRYYVLAMLPQLITFDFSLITKNDRKTAQTLRGFIAGKQKKKSHEDD